MKNLYVLNKLYLGNRELGYELYSEEDGILEMTAKQIKESLYKKSETRIYGLQVNQITDELELDEAFYTTNLMCKRHIGNYQAMKGNAFSNIFYIVLGKRVEKGIQVYEVITTRFLTLTLDEETVKSYLRLGIISGGAKLEKDTIIIPSDEKKPEVKQEPKVEKKQ